jgi:hypothetical protein
MHLDSLYLIGCILGWQQFSPKFGHKILSMCLTFRPIRHNNELCFVAHWYFEHFGQARPGPYFSSPGFLWLAQDLAQPEVCPSILEFNNEANPKLIDCGMAKWVEKWLIYRSIYMHNLVYYAWMAFGLSLKITICHVEINQPVNI